MNKVLITVLVVILLGAGTFFVIDSQKNPSVADGVKEQPTSAPAPTSESLIQPIATDGAMAEKGGVRTFNVDGTPFAFSVKEMKVKQGDTVKIVFTNKEGFHDWVIDEFNARTKQIAAGKSETIEFVADKKGTFEYYCSVGSHRAMGMKGNLIVE